MKFATSITSAAIRTLPATLLVLAAAVPGGSLLGQDLEQSFAVAEGDRVVLVVERANISVTSWDRSEVAFSATRVEGFEFEFSQEDGVVTISGSDEERGGIFRWWSWEPLAEVKMRVPYRQDLNLGTSGGDIQIDRLQGEVTALTSGGEIEAGEIDGSVDAATSGGRIRLQHASGSVSAATSGGSIQLETVAGEVEARTSGGGIRIGEAGGAVTARTSGGSIRIGETGAAVEARTSGGSIEVASAGGAVHARTSGGFVEAGLASQTEMDSELRTSGGNVTVYLREDFQADLAANTSGGGITSDFPELVPDNSAGGGTLEQAFNGGGPAVVLRTSGGSIRIRRLENETADSPRFIGF